MRHFARFQLIGPVIVFAAALAAEVAALGLAHHPASSSLWYLNLHMFGIFQQTHYVLDGATGIPASGLFFIALPTVCLACVGFALNKRIVLALASHVSFAYAIFLLCAWFATHPRTIGPFMQASLIFIHVPTGPNLFVAGILLAGSLSSAWLSHLIYIRMIRSRL
jgi:hypothetical protein